MIVKIIKKIPFIILTFSFINIIIVKILNFNKINVDSELLLKVTTIIFNPNNILYFNYWIIYISVALFISLYFSLIKKYSVIEMVVSIVGNSILFIITMIYIVIRM